MKALSLRFVIVSFLAIIAGCSLGAPESFMQMNRQYWESMDIKPSIKYEDAWQRVIYIITKKFELEMISKEDGYVRSAYGQSYFTEDLQNDRYQIRIVAKFTPDKKKFEFKIESRIWDGKIWNNGSDVRVAANMRKDFLNSLGEPQVKKQTTDSLQLPKQTAPSSTDSVRCSVIRKQKMHNGIHSRLSCNFFVIHFVISCFCFSSPIRGCI